MRKLGFVVLCFTVLLIGTVPAHATFPGANGKIAYSSVGAIFVMNPDGTGVSQLTPSASDDSLPVWSPDGSKIAFKDGYSADDPDRCPSPQEFQCWDIAVMNANGTGKTNISNSLGPSFDNAPSWSPDGLKIVFEHGIGASPGTDGIWTMNADGTGRAQLTTAANADLSPSWSPDGTRISFTRETASASADVYVMNADGSSVTRLTTAAGNDASPTWSPDGTKIAFVSQRSGNYDIWVMNSDGSGQTQITTDPGQDGGFSEFGPFGRPAWAPDGSRIAFITRRHEPSPTCGFCNYEVYTISPQGTGETRVTNTPAGEANLDWQPLRALDPFPRPGGATPLRVPLVPVLAQCTSPNSEHVAPLSSPSCTPAAPLSSLLTTSSTGKGQGYVRFDVEPGNPLNGTDEADLAIQASISDVKNTSDGSDYAGKLILNTTLRITDRASGFGGVSATTADFGFSMPLDCIATPDPPAIGGTCNLQTSVDTLLPGTAKEGKRAVIASRLIQMLDVGADGQIASSGCPPTCGTGDEQPFVRQGVFAP